MADGGVWRTIQGRKVFIKTGQSLTAAMQASGKSFGGMDKEKPKSEGSEAKKDAPVENKVTNKPDNDKETAETYEDKIKEPFEAAEKEHNQTKWENKALKYDSYDDFESNEAGNLMSEGILKSDNPIQEAKELYKEAHYKNSSKELKSIDSQKAVDAIRNDIPDNVMNGWFRNADSDYKPILENTILKNPELRNAGLNVAHEAYQKATGKDLDFDKFLDTEIQVYRGGNFDFVDNDVFVSYSFDKEIAKKFVTDGNSKLITEFVKPRDTLGSYQTDGEAELLVRRRAGK